jgi:hypothetical protein
VRTGIGPYPQLAISTTTALQSSEGLGFQTDLTYISGMLHLRKRPPSDRPTINAGTPWSAMDMADLEEFLTDGASVERIAE